ncbi:MAG: tetratricopeptide repeat protein [bacterium]
MKINPDRGGSAPFPDWSRLIVFPVFFLMAVMAAGGMSWAAGADPAVPPHLNVLVITIDTLRADHLGCYGYQGVKTPNIDTLARQGTVFQQSFTPVPVTLPSHVSIFTGTYPPFHGVRNNGNFILDAQALTLAEVLADQGYRTAAFIGAYVLDSYYGLDQGFQWYDDDFSEGASNEEELYQEKNAEQITREAVKWLENNGQSRFFIWLHYFDPHSPYSPPSPFLEEYRQNPYDGEIAYTDHWLGVLFHKLREQKLDDKTLIILTSDHGESLGEHNELTHGVFIYDATLRVPLILKGGPLPSSKTVSSQVRTLDLMPTVLQILGIDCPGSVQGKSLVNLINGQPDKEERVLYCESYLPYYNHGWSPLAGIRAGNWKYIKAPKPELYDLQKDAAEKQNRIRELSATQDQMEAKLKAMLSSIAPPEMKGDRKAEPQGDHALPVPDQDRLKKLMSLGYISTAPAGKKKDGSLADPKDKIGLMDYLNRGMGFLEARDPNQAIREFKALISQDPQNIFAHLILGSTYCKVKLYDLALEEFTTVARMDDSYMDIHNRLASVYQIKGMSDRAIEEYKTAIQKYPRCAENYNLLATVYLDIHRYDEAIEQLKEGIRLKPGFIRAHNNLGLAYGRKKNYALAIEEFQTALKSSPSIAEIYNNLGCVYLELGILLNQKENIPQFPIDPQEMEKIYQKIPNLQDHPAIAFDLARESFENSLKIDPRFKDARINLGIAYLNAGSGDKAVAEYKKILADDPSDIQSRLNLAVVYLQGGQVEQGRESLQEVLIRDPNNMPAHYYLGSTYMQAGQIENALAEYRRMVQIQPRNPDAHFYLGEAYRAKGQTRQAIEEYQQSLKINPLHIRAQQSLSAVTLKNNSP